VVSLPVGLAVSSGGLCGAGRGLVGLDIEVDEEEEVGRKKGTSKEGSTLSTSARAPGGKAVWLPGRLGGEVRVSCGYDE
jgi:hypothetical protein